MAFYDNLIRACDKNNITVSALCKKIGLSNSAYDKWNPQITSKPSVPKADTLLLLADALNVTVDFLLRGVESDNILSDEELRILNLYRIVSTNQERNDIINAIKSVIPQRYIRHYFDKVSAGKGVDLLSPSFVNRPIYRDSVSATADFIVTVEGNSMEDKFYDGDVLLVKNKDHANIEPGQIGIFNIDNVGYVKELGNGCLISLNPEYKPIYFADRQVDFEGLVIGKAKLII